MVKTEDNGPYLQSAERKQIPPNPSPTKKKKKKGRKKKEKEKELLF
jgi:hypothetical protein